MADVAPWQTSVSYLALRDTRSPGFGNSNVKVGDAGPANEAGIDFGGGVRLYKSAAGGVALGAPTGIALNADGNLDGQSGANANPYRIGLGVATVNGSNGARGDATNADAANGAGATYFAPFYSNIAGFADRGSITAFTSYATINEVGAGGVYGELFSFYGGVTSNRTGALTGAIEGQNTINAGKPARGSAANLIVKENNAPPTYTGAQISAEGAYTSAILGGTAAPAMPGAGGVSQWLRGARVIDVVSSGAQAVGVGINFRGAFARPILFDAGGANGFAVGSSGFVDVWRSASTSAAIRLFDSSVNGGANTQQRFSIRVDGRLQWGGGVTGEDVFASRVATTVPTLQIENPLTLKSYTTAARPAIANVTAGSLIYVSDAAAGSKLQYSDGAAWVAAG